MRVSGYFVVGFFLGILLVENASALTISPKDRAFIGGAAITYMLMKSRESMREEEDPCWRGGWDDGTPCYRDPPLRMTPEAACPSSETCSAYPHPYEQNACFRGIVDCRQEANRGHWRRMEEAYLRGRGNKY